MPAFSTGIGYVLCVGATGSGSHGGDLVDWLADFTAPQFDGRAMSLIAPVVVVLVSGNLCHIKVIAAVTGCNLDCTVLGRRRRDGDLCIGQRHPCHSL